MPHSRYRPRLLRPTLLALIILLLLILSQFEQVGRAAPALQPASANPAPAHFAVVGDYGYASQSELDVANLIKSWNPDFITTVGDNNYLEGAASTIDQNIGQYYHSYIYPYMGSYGSGAVGTNRFFPVLGNHDWIPGTEAPYHNYFTLPGNERYYDFVRGPVHFFMIDSDPHEPDGITSNSAQAIWLQNKLASSTSIWRLVYMHHPPYSSGSHGSTSELQWPYKAWGASAVLAGHDHDYERIINGNLPYFVVGTGGYSLYPFTAPALSGTQIRYSGDFGAMLVDSNETSLTFKFYNRTGLLIDNYALTNPRPATPSNLVATTVSGTQIDLSWSDNSSTETGYRLERKIGLNGTWALLNGAISPNQTAYSDNGLSPGTLYYYRVQAFNANGTSAYSNQASAATPGDFVVRLNTDNGSQAADSLSYALRNATSGMVITFALTSGNTITVSNLLPDVKSGVKILGKCNPDGSGPAIIISGLGVTGDGLVLDGPVTLYGLQITHFAANQLKFANTFGNQLSCVIANR